MNKRLMLALGVFFVFMLVWPTIGKKLGWVKVVEVPAVEEPLASNEEPQEPPSEIVSNNEPQQPVENSSPEDIRQVEPQTVTLENEVLRLVVDNRGGVIRSAKLKAYTRSVKTDEWVELISGRDDAPGELILSSGESTDRWMYDLERPKSNAVRLSYQRGAIRVEKTFELSESYGLITEVVTEGLGETYMVVAEGLQNFQPDDQLRPSIWSFGAINPKYMQVAWSEDGDHENKDLGDDPKPQWEALLKKEQPLEWAGVADNYFANVFLGEKTFYQAYTRGTYPHEGIVSKPFQTPAVALRLDQGSLRGMFFMGPKIEEVAAGVDARLENVVTYGWAGLLSKGLFYLLRLCHDLTGNWGWAIVTLTLLLRVFMIPLLIPGIRSSIKMRAVQPKLDALKKKYSGDDIETKQKMASEQFKLYKEEGVNPFSSCVTGLAQAPIFIAYFSLLRASMSLRQADWMFWIEDLSMKDPTYILPLIMAGTMFLSMQTMQMPSTDPAQQRIMKVLPIFMGLFFIGMPSGLIIYMITSNVFAFGQSLIMKRRYAQHERSQPA